MFHIRFSGNATVFCLCLLFFCLPFSAGQEAPVTPAAENVIESVEPLKIMVSVNEVRLDVVALDKKNGNPVTDLTADDFEVYQNGRRQNVLSSVYVDAQSGAVAKPSVAKKAGRNLMPISAFPTGSLKKEDVRRTIIFVVDDITMDFENVYYAKMALRNFVEKQMLPGDMIAILRTGYGNSAIQMFLSDKREALARIDAMRFDVAIEPDIKNHMDLFRIYDNQLSGLSYSLRALKDMPGRKILIMMTTQTTLRAVRVKLMNNAPKDTDFNAAYESRFSRLADDALRAGVVVNFLNIRGLRSITTEDGVILGADASSRIASVKARLDLFSSITGSGTGSNDWQALTASLDAEELYTYYAKAERKQTNPYDGFNPLPAKTGGVLIEDNNFFLEGIGKETESLMKGYYLISYAPPPATFSSGDKEIFNQIRIKVKRKNVQVYTRDGFFSRLKNEDDADAPAAHPLQEAIFSPFQHADITVDMTAGYIKDAKAGYLIRSWIHLDPKDVKIVEIEDGGARIDLEMMCLTSDTNGYVQDSKFGQLTISNVNSPENIALLQRHGIRFAMLLPVKKPGSYYVHTAVKDAETGKIGSAYQFVEIPDLDKKWPTLSNIFMAVGAEDLDWMGSDLTAEIAEGLIFSGFQDKETRSPALRTYAVGEGLLAKAMLYNADAKAIAGSEIEIKSVLYKDGVEYTRGEPWPITPDKAQNPDGMPISQGLSMIPPGDYVLQLVTTDKTNSKKKESVATQTINFTVIENQTCETGNDVCAK